MYAIIFAGACTYTCTYYIKENGYCAQKFGYYSSHLQPQVHAMIMVGECLLLNTDQEVSFSLGCYPQMATLEDICHICKKQVWACSTLYITMPEILKEPKCEGRKYDYPVRCSKCFSWLPRVLQIQSQNVKTRQRKCSLLSTLKFQGKLESRALPWVLGIELLTCWLWAPGFSNRAISPAPLHTLNLS